MVTSCWIAIAMNLSAFAATHATPSPTQNPVGGCPVCCAATTQWTSGFGLRLLAKAAGSTAPAKT